MRNTKTLLSIAVATGLGITSLSASAAAPTVYGDLAIAFVYSTSAADAGKGAKSSYAVYDNVSLLGVKGDVATIDGIKYFYDFNFILNQGGLGYTHLSMVGMDGGFGTVTIGKRDNGLFLQMVDGGAYATNYFYAPGMSSFQVSDSIKYVSKAMGGFQYGVQVFDIGKSPDAGSKATTNVTLAGTYAMGNFTFGAGYTDYADIGGANTADKNQFSDAQNVWSGTTLKSTTGVSAAYKAGKLGVVLAYDMRKPVDSSPVTSTINTAMLTGTYAVTDKTTLAGNYSHTSQTDGVKGNIITAMISYAPNPALFYSFEIATADKDANTTGLTGSLGAYNGLYDGTTSGPKGSSSAAVGVTYNF